MTLFEMAVKDTFRLGNRMTAFVGPIKTDLKFIRACDCEIVMNDDVIASIRIDGEMIPKRERGAKGESASYRSISSSERIDFEALGIKKSGFVIRSKK